MSKGTNQSIYIGDDNQTVTTSVAADYLGVSRQYCVRNLERGDIPCHYLGTHRRIYLKDVLSYVNHRTFERKAALVTCPQFWYHQRPHASQPCIDL
jgi:excisionase family DNA binding protein